MKLIIKYPKAGNFIENEFYEIKFESSKCVQVVSIDDGFITEEGQEEFFEHIDGTIIQAQYKGVSRVDEMDIFLIYPIQIMREMLINKIVK